MPKRLATRQLIVEAVIRCIEKYGLNRVTTRRIALEAGTNIASINYHFRTKEELIAETLALTIKHMVDDVTQALADDRQPFDAMLRDVFRYLLAGSWRYPGISKAHLSQAVIEGRRDSVGSRAMVRIFKRLLERAVRAYPSKNRRFLKSRLAQVMGSIIFVLLAPDFFGVMPRQRRAREARAEADADSFAALFLRSV